MAKNGLLIVSNLSKISSSLSKAKELLPKILYVQFFNQEYLPPPNYSSDISKIYSSSASLGDTIDVRVIVSNLKTRNWCKVQRPLDFLIFDQELSDSTKETFQKNYSGLNIITLDGVFEQDQKSDVSDEKMYENVILGGTFDRIHAGHKILLTEAVIRTQKRLVIGVTDVNMIQCKHSDLPLYHLF